MSAQPEIQTNRTSRAVMRVKEDAGTACKETSDGTAAHTGGEP